MDEADFLIVGGGIAGLSVGASLSAHGKVVVLERELGLGAHSSGRSATFSHFGIGDRIVRELTGHSRNWFLGPGRAFCRTSAALFVATEEMRPALGLLAAETSRYGELVPCRMEEAKAIFPPLRIGRDAVIEALLYRDGLRLDSDALLQHFARNIRRSGGEIHLGTGIDRIEEVQGRWTVTAGERRWSGGVIVNAAGAWADAIAELAHIPPIGLTPFRRTIIVLDPPAGSDVRAWPFVKTAADDFYILPESGRLMASPVDEVASFPCDAQPEDYDVALAAWKVELYTSLSVTRIPHRWAGLRTFAPDRRPVVGHDPNFPNFFWLAGQGGFGLQTAPALAEAAAALLTRSAWPADLAARGVSPHMIAPQRLREA